MGGSSFETHLPGAWFFGMPGGTFGWLGTNAALPTISSLALVFGGLILLTRVWLGLLRYLRQHEGFPVRRVVLVVFVWAVPLLAAPPLFSRDVYTYAAQGEMVSHHINPYLYGPSVLGATSYNEMADSVWSNTESPYGPTFLTADGVLDQASGHQILPDLLLLRLLALAGVGSDGRGHPHVGPIVETRSGPCRAPRRRFASRPARTARRRPQRRPDGRSPDGRLGRGQACRHRARDHSCARWRRG